MKALNLYTRQDVRCEEIAIPDLENGDDVLIKVQVAGICGSDISRFGKLGSYHPGLTWGHEFSGIVVRTGAKVRHLKAGDRVTACNCFPCRHCEQCQQGRFARCLDLKVLGGHKKGAFAEYINVPAANVIHLPPDMDFETASFIEPSSVVAHGYGRLSISAGDRVAVVGCGTIGLLAVQWAKILGAGEVYAFDTDSRKLEIARQTGADAVFDVTQAGYQERFLARTDGRGAGAVVESSGSAAGAISAMMLAARGGSVLLLGIPYSDVAFPRLNFERIIRNELNVVGSWNSISAPFPGREWASSVSAIVSGRISVKPLITHRIRLEDAPTIFPQLYDREMFFVKVLIDIGGDNQL